MRFCDIPGHSETKRRLVEIADSGKIPHALLFEGPEGIGKTALARAFVQYVDCRNRSNGDSCGECPSCRQHAIRQHIDTIFSFPYKKKRQSPHVSPASDWLDDFIEFMKESPYMDESVWIEKLDTNTRPLIYVDEAADLIRRFSFAPHVSRYKSVIMWQADRLNLEAANKLLKVIEEPPGETIIVMTSSKPMDVLPTIYSRAQRIKVKRLSDDEIAHWMVYNADIPHDTAAGLAPLAQGSILEAQRIVERRTDNELFLQYFIELMRLAYQRKIADLKKWSAKLAKEKRDTIVDFLQYAGRMLRENFIANLGVPDLNLMMPDEEKFSINFARFVNEKNAPQHIDAVTEAIADIRSNANAKIVLFDLAITVILLIKEGVS